jgi:hypothetical protein
MKDWRLQEVKFLFKSIYKKSAKNKFLINKFKLKKLLSDGGSVWREKID